MNGVQQSAIEQATIENGVQQQSAMKQATTMNGVQQQLAMGQAAAMNGIQQQSAMEQAAIENGAQQQTRMCLRPQGELKKSTKRMTTDRGGCQRGGQGSVGAGRECAWGG